MEIKFTNVNFWYDKKSKQKILDSINLKIKNNTITGITGKSGSGKTTLIELINAINIPSSGKIVIGEFIINKKKNFDVTELRNKIGFVSQNSEDQIFNKKVIDELSYPFLFLKRDFDEKKMIEVLNLVGLDESYLNRNPLLLSNGEKRKIVIAATLVLDTDILIFDDPTNGLDYKSVKNFERLIKNLKNNFGKTIIVVSRDTEFLLKISDQVVIMNDGKILIQGDKYSVFKDTDLLNEYNLPVPKTIEFSNIVLNKKNVRIGYRDEINDLLKDIYRYVK